MRRTIPALALAFALLGADAARADIIYLKDGGKVEGKAEVRGDEVIVRRGSGKFVYPRSAVLRIERTPTAEEIYAERSGALEADDLAGHLELARWCREKALSNEMRAECEAALKIEPEHEEAHRLLGHVKHEGRWMTLAESMKAQGYAFGDGRWLSPAEQEARERAEREKREAEARLAEMLALVAKLASEDAEEVASAQAAIEKDADNYRLVLAHATRSGKKAAARKEALLALGRIGYEDDPQGPKYSNLIAHLAVADLHVDVRNAAVKLIRERRDDFALTQLVRLAALENSYRRLAAAAIRQIGDRRAIWELVRILSGQPRRKGTGLGGMAADFLPEPGKVGMTRELINPAADSLEFITGQEFGNDAARWAAWLRKTAPAIEVKP